MILCLKGEKKKKVKVENSVVPGHTLVPIAPLVIHKALQCNWYILNKLVLSQEKPPDDANNHSNQLDWIQKDKAHIL